MDMEGKTKRAISRLKNDGVRFLDELPDGWRLIGVRVGDYEWADNGKSRFSPKHDRESALVRVVG